MELEDALKDQIQKLAVAQYLIWLKEPPEGGNWEAIELSFAYHLLGLPFDQKASRLTLRTANALIIFLAKKLQLPEGLAELKELERTFRLEIGGRRYPVSDCAGVNKLLAEAGSKLRLCSGLYGTQKFFLLAEASESRVGKHTVCRLKRETAITPGCHLLMAAMVSGKQVFLRESSAHFLFYQKWQSALAGSDPIKRAVLRQFGIRDEATLKARAKALVAAFMDNLFYHELNHSSLDDYLSDTELLPIAQASAVLGQNVLNHLLEVFADWLPGEETKSPIQTIIAGKELPRLALYIADNWFYGSSFPENKLFSSLGLAPLFRHLDGKKFNWGKVMKEMKELDHGSLINLYIDHFTRIARGLKAIAEEAEFIINDRPVKYITVAAYVMNKLQDHPKDDEYQTTYWSNVFQYLKRFARPAYRRAMDYLADQEATLVAEVKTILLSEHPLLDDHIIAKGRQLFEVAND